MELIFFIYIYAYAYATGKAAKAWLFYWQIQ